MAVLSKIKSHPSVVHYFKQLPFYNKPIKKPKVKRLKTIDQSAELPFCEHLSITKTNQAFRGYAKSCKVEIVEWKDPTVQLEANKLSIKDLFSVLLNETKSFKYQITVKVLLKKCKLNGEIEFTPVYFNSTTKTVINHRFRLENAFQEILYLIDIGLMKNLAGLLNQSSLNTLIFWILIFTMLYSKKIKNKEKHLDISLFYTCVLNILIWFTVLEI